ncbi:hypothetical protein EROM_090830 [Encephalitozoon romaleae SJ-2008]|uniref:Leucine-rich repeat-containing protein n=1 Tax=Encephalitozoon romaleae (strain SJ-2008) TaxID=1178016 RepID=I7APE5_ENCRO|nr:hypothetical protein EROM_090830 [Encephalitozoon romaleae SJ-2008]AFN83699.1 hypothetical protein EROM_090830 [Encephalitozoon romaleae SJ-2008]
MDNLREAASIVRSVDIEGFCDLCNMDLELISPDVMEALKTNKLIKKLDLSSNKLKELPSDIGALNWLVELDLSNNEIGKIPEEMNDMKSLEVLNLSNNKLTSFPWKVLRLGRTGTLKSLDLRGNPLYRIYHTAFGRFFLRLFYGDIVKTGYDVEETTKCSD